MITCFIWWESTRRDPAIGTERHVSGGARVLDLAGSEGRDEDEHYTPFTTRIRRSRRAASQNPRAGPAEMLICQRKRMGPGGPRGLQIRSLAARAARLGSTPRRFRH